MREIQESMETQRREFESRLRDLGAQMVGPFSESFLIPFKEFLIDSNVD